MDDPWKYKIDLGNIQVFDGNESFFWPVWEEIFLGLIRTSKDVAKDVNWNHHHHHGCNEIQYELSIYTIYLSDFVPNESSKRQTSK